MVDANLSTLLDFSTILDFCVVQGNLLCGEGGVYLSSVFLYLKFVVTLCATEGFEKTLDLSLLFEAFSW